MKRVARGIAPAHGRAITKAVKRDGRSSFDEVETAEFRELSATIEALKETIAEVKEERERANQLENAAHSLYKGSGGRDGTSTDISRRWAEDAATALHKMSGESRAVISGSIDVPIQVPLSPTQFGIPFPQRLIDILPNRISIDSYAFEYYEQTARTITLRRLPTGISDALIGDEADR